MGRKTPHPETCERCPNRYARAGCPAWIRANPGQPAFTETNVQTKETRIVTGCFYEVMPRLMSYVVEAANRPAAALESWRNEMITGFKHVATALPRAHDPKIIEHEDAPRD